ncbi:hypothetical protein M501DRAFT_993833 [Patellaria atrata CBS 101060]|uniref:Secreted protein n=1 Tax=Patellaria atrata CBS 101060 TaxID=1346257 RepID=A0A9P4VTD7_9PEZI|nr:hypothetical protein M501DRAFT_993833 [Patellaria atrata CBS 101060]
MIGSHALCKGCILVVFAFRICGDSSVHFYAWYTILAIDGATPSVFKLRIRQKGEQGLPILLEPKAVQGRSATNNLLTPYLVI